MHFEFGNWLMSLLPIVTQAKYRNSNLVVELYDEIFNLVFLVIVELTTVKLSCRNYRLSLTVFI